MILNSTKLFHYFVKTLLIKGKSQSWEKLNSTPVWWIPSKDEISSEFPSWGCLRGIWQALETSSCNWCCLIEALGWAAIFFVILFELHTKWRKESHKPGSIKPWRHYISAYCTIYMLAWPLVAALLLDGLSTLRRCWELVRVFIPHFSWYVNCKGVWLLTWMCVNWSWFNVEHQPPSSKQSRASKTLVRNTS